MTYFPALLLLSTNPGDATNASRLTDTGSSSKRKIMLGSNIIQCLITYLVKSNPSNSDKTAALNRTSLE